MKKIVQPNWLTRKDTHDSPFADQHYAIIPKLQLGWCTTKIFYLPLSKQKIELFKSGTTEKHIGDGYLKDIFRSIREDIKRGRYDTPTIDRHRFDPTKWKAKEKLDYRFSHQIDRWYREKEDEMGQGKLAPSYVPKLFTYMKHYYLPFFSDMDVREIHSVKDFTRQLPKRLSLKYQKNILDALRHFFRWMKEDRLIEEIPVFKKFEIPEHVPTVISPDTQKTILDLIPQEHKPIFTFLLYQGCRPSEARALKWKDIQGDTVVIRRTWSASALREQTKTKRIRYNLLFQETLMALPERRFPDDFVFTHGKKVKRHYSHNYLNKIFNSACSACKNLGLRIELYEATKHSFGTWYINHGADKHLLKEWFGHASTKSTEIYAKMDVVQKFRGIVGGQDNKVVDIKNRHQTATKS